EASVEKMNKETYPESFDNLDPETGEIRITPHTPCPILYGIRSESPEAAVRAQKLVEEKEPVEWVVLFKTNQATDEHLEYFNIDEVEPYRSVILEGIVSEGPETIEGGHVFFSIKDDSDEIRCAAFEPTGKFRKIVRKLKLGDKVRVYGGVKEKEDHPLTVNLEKIEILNLKTVKKILNPVCEDCGKNMKSEGRDKGYYCEKCGKRLPSDSFREIEVDRQLETKLYEVPPHARRHLSKPLIRMAED
ncbi:hypothetical protein AKJ56_02295, partial [candidate division MSBL1 archaeon SCGC-AAA382N08]